MANIHGISPPLGKALAEAGGVCLESQGHAVGVVLSVRGYSDNVYPLNWPPITEQSQRSWNDPEVATEHGAVGVAVLLILKETGYTVIESSRKGTGFDYWLGDETDALPMNSKARLEVSGHPPRRRSFGQTKSPTEIATDQPFRRAVAASFCNRGRVWPAHCRRYKEMNSLSEPRLRVKNLHDDAMALAHLAVLQRSRGNKEESQSQFEQALDYELAAIEALEELAALTADEPHASGESIEPTYSVLHRSAGTLALDCKQTRNAEKIVAKALSQDPPPGDRRRVA